MARGNFRSTEAHGVAEIGGRRKIIDRWVMKKAKSCKTEKEALDLKSSLELGKYIVIILKTKNNWNVWRTVRPGQVQIKE